MNPRAFGRECARRLKADAARTGGDEDLQILDVEIHGAPPVPVRHGRPAAPRFLLRFTHPRATVFAIRNVGKRNAAE
jgi:hypothetical protein